MSRVLKNELQILRENLMTCFQKTLPSKQYRALLFLSTLGLHVLADKEAKTEDPKERRCIEDEFDEGKSTIVHGIEMLYEQTERNPEETVPNPTRTLPQMRSAYATDRTVPHLSGLRRIYR